MSFFVSEIEGELFLTTAGYVTSVILLLLVLISAAAFVKKNDSAPKFSVKQLTFCAAAMALAMVTSMIKLYSFPFGGSITLFSMLFICLIGYIYGPTTGILTGAAYGILQFIIEPYIYFPLQVLVDYPLAFGALGLSGFFFRSKNGLVKGYLLGILGRFFFAFLSGWLFFGEYAWEGWGAVPYSIVYNGCYIFTEAAITVIILMIPSVKDGIAQVKKLALN